MAFGNKGASTDAAVCHAWAHQTTNYMHKNSMFFSGRTIYSYGHHFPIATILKKDDNVVLFTTRDYSPSTSAHKWKVRSAVSHKTLIFCDYIPDSGYGEMDASDHAKNIRAWTTDVKNKLGEITAAKRDVKRDRLMGELSAIQAEAKIYIDYFKLKLKAAEKKQLFTTDIAGFAEGVRKAEAAAKRKAAALVKKGKELHPVWLEHWRNFTDGEFTKSNSHDILNAVHAVERDGRDGNWTRLRTIDGVIYSSKGIKIPVDIAHRYYRKYLAVVKAGGCSADCNYMMLEFKVQEMNAEHLLVGCHDIARSEIDYIAEKLGWVKEKETA